LIEDAELEALLGEDPCQTQKKLAESLGVNQSTISMRLKTLGIIQKQGNWVPINSSQEAWKGVFSCVNNCSNDKNGNVFCIISLLAMKSGYTTTI